MIADNFKSLKKMNIFLNRKQLQSLDDHGNTIVSFTKFKKMVLDKYFLFDPYSDAYLKDKKAYILPDIKSSKGRLLTDAETTLYLDNIYNICVALDAIERLKFNYPKKIKMKFVYDHEFYYDSYFVLSVRKD